MTNETTDVQVVENIQGAFAGIPQQQEMPLALVRGQPVLHSRSFSNRSKARWIFCST
jgi:hypothetical protein